MHGATIKTRTFYTHASKDKAAAIKAKRYMEEAQLHLFSELAIDGGKWQQHVPASLPHETTLNRH